MHKIQKYKIYFKIIIANHVHKIQKYKKWFKNQNSKPYACHLKRSGDSRQALFQPTDFSTGCNWLDLLLSHLYLDARWLVVDYLCPILGFSCEYCCLQTQLCEYCYLVDSLCRDCCLVVCLREVKASAPPPSYFSCLIKLRGLYVSHSPTKQGSLLHCLQILAPCSYPMLQH